MILNNLVPSGLFGAIQNAEPGKFSDNLIEKPNIF
jgi:hypothetical protein